MLQIRIYCSKCGCGKPPDSSSYCRPCFREYRKSRGPRTYDQCGSCKEPKKRTRASRCGPCSWEREKERTNGYVVCRQCGVSKKRGLTRFCVTCRAKRFKNAKEHGLGTSVTCSRCMQTKKRGTAPYCLPCGRIYERELYARNPEHFLQKARIRRARLYGAPGTFSSTEWEAIKARQLGLCAHCKLSKKLDRDHIVPLVLGGTNWIENIQGLCTSCNSRKGGRWVG